MTCSSSNDNNLNAGVYQIRNVLNNRVYIGSTIDFKVRWQQHIKNLRKNKHNNCFLQADFNKCGEPAFVFEVVEVTENKTKEQRLLVEKWYIEQHFGKQCYNLRINPCSRDEGKDKNPEVSKKRRSEALKRRYQDPEQKERLSARFRELWQQPEYREKILEHVRSPESVQKFKDSCRSKEAMSKMAASKAKHWGRIISPTGVVFDITNMCKFCREHGLCKQSMMSLFKNKDVHYACGGWRLYDDKLIGVPFIPEYSWEKPFKLVAPDGSVVEGKNLTKFCREHKLNQGDMYAVLYGKGKSYKGWRSYSDSLVGVPFKPTLSHTKTFQLVGPDGSTYKGDNVSEFCRAHSLNINSTYLLLRGVWKEYKGWTTVQ